MEKNIIGNNEMIKSTNKDKIFGMKKKDFTFYCLMLLFPIVHFVLFYIVVNFDFLAISFQEYSYGLDGSHAGYAFVGFDNFKSAFQKLSTLYELRVAWKNSTIAYVVSTFVIMPLGLMFSFYIYKKMPLSRAFRIILFLPSIVPTIVMVILFKYFSEDAIPAVVQSVFNIKMKGLMSNTNTRFFMLVFFSVWTSFGGSVLLYVGAMGGIDESIVEAAAIDGASQIREFFSITLALIYPTLSTFIYSGVGGYFAGQLHLFTFYGPNAELADYTFGYYLFKAAATGSHSAFPELSALGIIFTLIITPITLFVRWGLNKLGPSAN